MSNDKRHKIKKGTFGYLPYQKKKNIIQTILLFVLALLIYITGYISTGTRANLLTIVAMLGMLPASKSAVEMILFLRQKNCSREINDQIRTHEGDFPMAYELVLTSYDRNFPISSIAVQANTVCGYTENEHCDVAAAEKHISDILKQNGYKPAVKLFKELEKYNNRLDALKDLESDSADKDAEIMEVIKAISI
ncbi:MAG: hypothetical protein PHE02_12665 [Lachnospiraceae bacterium]|nr:hypothetical protein [Lachnospiraceae bacterium]